MKNSDEERKELDNIAQSDSKERINRFLHNEPMEVQIRVRETIDIFNIDPEDPFFIILIQCRISHILYDLTPNRINQSFDQGLISVEQTLKKHNQEFLEALNNKTEKISEEALRKTKHKLDNAIANILEDNNISYKKSRFSPRAAAAAITSGGMLAALCIGLLGGFSFSTSTVANKWIENKNTKDLAAFEWAKSSEGQFARKLLEWNGDLYGKSCQQKARNLGISFAVGSLEMIDGFCVVHVVPESKRQYRKKK